MFAVDRGVSPTTSSLGPLSESTGRRRWEHSIRGTAGWPALPHELPPDSTNRGLVRGLTHPLVRETGRCQKHTAAVRRVANPEKPLTCSSNRPYSGPKGEPGQRRMGPTHTRFRRSAHVLERVSVWRMGCGLSRFRATRLKRVPRARSCRLPPLIAARRSVAFRLKVGSARHVGARRSPCCTTGVGMFR